MKWILIASVILLSGCASLFENRMSEEEVAQIRAQKASEEAEVVNAEKVLEKARFEEARILFRDFQGRHSQSVFFQQARLGEAQSLEGLGRYQEAADLYRDIYLKTLKHQPEIAALALYRMSFAYEALGDDLKTVAALLDARRMGEHLPLEVAYAEVPARLAAAYARQNRENEALTYLNEAEKGISIVQQEKGANLRSDWLAKTYVQMGTVSTNQLSSDNFSEFVQGQKLVQVYLIKALRLNDSAWSPRALSKLQETYRDLYTQVESAKNRETQNSLGGDLFDLLDQAELYRPMTGQKMNSYENSFFAYLSEVRKKTEKIVYGSGGTMSLTEESAKLNSLKRGLPQTKKRSIPLPPKVVPEEDPNL
ncbi:tetratricopeptide repeat protein [Bdellovibrio sp. BCCA]|uniref:tetratricopeptide repeat protein n=1 Tax=Bdellovibrio sp. BCCA TaxID=3136281 RepID=UPI0030F07D78